MESQSFEIFVIIFVKIYLVSCDFSEDGDRWSPKHVRYQCEIKDPVLLNLLPQTSQSKLT